MCRIGIRKEDKYLMEKRVPLTPGHVERLIKQYKLEVVVQSSEKRIFKDEEFLKAGAKVNDSLKECLVIFGIKEIPIEVFEPEKTYVMFAHVIKGQPSNMPMLKRMMDLKCNLIDYERVADELGRRLIFFGKYAGMAGMINTLWSFGLRLKYFGQVNPFASLKQAHKYNSLAEAKDAISEVGHYIAENGLPSELMPLTIGFIGYGNVSSGAQELCGLLPVMEIKPEELLILHQKKCLSKRIVYKVVFREEDMVELFANQTDSKELMNSQARLRIENGELRMEIPDKFGTGGELRNEEKDFDLLDYYNNPSKYRSKFEKYVPYLTMLVNCMYWDKRYPRIITKEYLKKLFSGKKPKLTVIGDISCDIEGSVECTIKSTPIEDPIYVYNPFTEQITIGYEGEGILDMPVDILPSELPKDSSLGFGDILYNFVNPIANADYNEKFEDLKLPFAVKKGMILHKGELTPDYQYIQQYLK